MKTKKVKDIKKVDADGKTDKKETAVQPMPKMSKEMEQKLKELKGKLDKFKDIILQKFDKYIIGVVLLPPEQKPPMQSSTGATSPSGAPQDQKPHNDKRIDVLVLIDDSDVKKMTKWELRDKLIAIFDSTAKEIDENIRPDPLLLSDLWQSCYDGKYDLLKLIAMGAPVYDTGMVGAIKLAEIHKSMVLKKFEKYIVAYVLAGSLVQGRATPSSDVDVWIVIDD